MRKITAADVLQMPIAERILLVEEVWDSIAEVPEAVTLTDTQREELDRRLEDHRQNPQQNSPWGEVCARLRGH